MAHNTGTKILWVIGGLLFGGGLFTWLWARERVDSLGFANDLSIALGRGNSEDYLDALSLVTAAGVVMDFGAAVLLLALAVSAIGEFVLRAGRASKHDEVRNSEG